MTNGLPAFTILDEWPNPLAGRLVIVGVFGSGLIAAPTVGVSDIAGKLTTVRPAPDPLFESFTAKGKDTIFAGTRGIDKGIGLANRAYDNARHSVGKLHGSIAGMLR